MFNVCIETLDVFIEIIDVFIEIVDLYIVNLSEIFTDQCFLNNNFKYFYS